MTHQTITLHCAQCGARISGELRHLRDHSRVDTSDAAPLLPSGSFVVAEELRRRYRNSSIQAGSILLAIGDLVKIQRGGVRNGCCGVDGMDGPNLFCRSGHVVGTEVADCWTPHFAHFPPALIRVRGPDTDGIHRAPPAGKHARESKGAAGEGEACVSVWRR